MPGKSDRRGRERDKDLTTMSTMVVSTTMVTFRERLAALPRLVTWIGDDVSKRKTRLRVSKCQKVE
jgi:hypothetical protein